MNVKKLSLASLFLVLSCSFGWAQETTECTFVRLTSETQLVHGTRVLFVVSSDRYNTGHVAMAGMNGNKRYGTGVTVTTSEIDEDMELIKTAVNSGDHDLPVALTLNVVGENANGTIYAFYDEVEEAYFGAPNSQGNTSYNGAIDNERCQFNILYNSETNGFEIYNVDDPKKFVEHRETGEPEFTVSKDGNPHALLFVEYTNEIRITLARSDYGDDLNYYATVYYEKDVKLDENISAFDVTPVPTTPETQELTLTEVVTKGEILWAKSPVILMFPNDSEDAPAYVDYPIYLLTEASEDKTIETHLQGTTDAIDAPENSFKLRKQAVEVEETDDALVAFFKAEGTSILANKAYYVLGEAAEEGEETGEVKVLTFSFSGATGIEKVNTPQEVNNGAIYNLAGQQVNKNYRGIVLKNGKKFLNK